MIDETNKLIKLDARFSSLLEEFGYPTYQKENQYFKSLLRSIIYQQLSGKAASKIHNRFLAIYDSDSHPTPDEVKLTSSDVIFGIEETSSMPKTPPPPSQSAPIPTCDGPTTLSAC